MNGHFASFRLAGDEMEKRDHGGDAVDHAFVHADIDDLRAVLDLLARDCDRVFVLPFFDELGEFRRTGDIRALAEHDVDTLLLCEGL